MKGHVRSRGKNSWTIYLYLGRNERGKHKYQTHTFKGSRKEAEQEQTRLVNEVNKGTYVEPTRMTVGEFLEKWLSDYAQAKVSPKTLERYREIVNCHLIPALGKHLLNKLKPLPIQSYYAEALRTGRRDGGGGLKAQTVLHHHRVLRQALGQAVKWQLLAFNPASATEPPRPDRREMKVLDGNNVGQLLKLVRESSIHIEILLAVTTGMRRGEILALRWADVDFKKVTLAVQQSLEQTRAGGLRFKRPKTERGRVVVLPALVVGALKRHRAEQATRRLQLGPAYHDADLVCCLADGTPRSPAGLTRAFRDLLADKQLPRVRFHDLRHTHATLLLSQGTHPKVVSERLGHSTVGITLDTYSHVLPSMQEEAAQQLNNSLRAAIGKAKRK